MRTLSSALLVIALAASNALAQHQHITAGVADANGNNQPDQGEALAFISGYASGTVYPMTYRQTGTRYAGYYASETITFIGLSDGQALAGAPELGRAMTGSYLWLEISSVSGPAGAHLGFWDENHSNFGTTPNLSLATNSPTGGYKFEISEPLDFPSAPPGAITEPSGLHYIVSGSTTGLLIDPGEDPYGHIHNRAFTVDRPGEYFVGLRLYDLSTNGPGGIAHHTPSVEYVFRFVAVPEPGSIALLGAVIALLAIRRSRPA